jgi:hypothetical protein
MAAFRSPIGLVFAIRNPLLRWRSPVRLADASSCGPSDRTAFQGTTAKTKEYHNTIDSACGHQAVLTPSPPIFSTEAGVSRPTSSETQSFPASVKNGPFAGIGDAQSLRVFAARFVQLCARLSYRRVRKSLGGPTFFAPLDLVHAVRRTGHRGSCCCRFWHHLRHIWR